MRKAIMFLVGLLCIGSAAFGQYPAVSGTVTRATGVASYTYTVLNNTARDIWQFSVQMPFLASTALTSISTSQTGWSTFSMIRTPDLVIWDWSDSNAAIHPGSSANFSFTTPADVATTYAFHDYGVSSNWTWYGAPSWDGGYGNTRVPVPTSIYFVPEPSSLLALGMGALPIAGMLLRRRRRGANSDQ